MSQKIFVEVLAKFNLDGNITPVSILWQDGRIFEIDKITEVCRRASTKAGGQGQRYTCKIMGQERYLFMEHDKKWFLEAKE